MEGESAFLTSWSFENTKLLIAIKKANRKAFTTGKMRKKEAWNLVAEELNATVGEDVQVTGEQCSKKWKKLEDKFKKTAEHNAKTGRDMKTCPFYKELADALGNNPKITPVCTVSSAAVDHDELSGQSDSSEEGQEGQEGSTRKKRKKESGPKKRRRSRSSAAEMIDFLKEFREEKKVEDQEKLNALQKMHDDKMDMMGRFLTIMDRK